MQVYNKVSNDIYSKIQSANGPLAHLNGATCL